MENIKRTNNLSNISNIEHGFVTRCGGFSTKSFLESNNFSFMVGDDADIVVKNRNFLLKHIGFTENSLVTPNQNHTNKVIVVTSDANLGGNRDEVADAVITNVSGIPIGVLTADCLPILGSSRDGKVVFAIHAGWKGAVDGVIYSTFSRLRDMGYKSEDCLVAIGPCIHRYSYEVGEDFYNNFASKDTYYSKFFTKSETNEDVYYFDLLEFGIHLLHKEGVSDIDIIDEDTVSNPKSWYSFRRQTVKNDSTTGRFLSIIGIRS